MNAYQKECRSTIIFAVLYTLLAHTGLFAILLGVDNDLRLFGLPLHYTLAILLGSAGILIVSIVWNRYADRLEEQIQSENAGAEAANGARSIKGSGER